MRRSAAFVIFALLVSGANARALSGLLYTNQAEIDAVNKAQQKGAADYYVSSAAAASAGAQPNQIVTINGNNNNVDNSAVTTAIASAEANSATDSTDTWPSSSPSPSPSPVPSPSSPSPIPSPSPKPCTPIGGTSPAPGSSPSPNGSPTPSGGCMTNWRVGDAGYFSNVDDVTFADPVPLVGCDGKSLSPKDPVSKFSDCSSACSATTGCFSFSLDLANRCTFVTNDSDSPIKISKGSRIFFWQGSYQMIDSSKLPSNCFSNATIPHN